MGRRHNVVPMERVHSVIWLKCRHESHGVTSEKLAPYARHRIVRLTTGELVFLDHDYTLLVAEDEARRAARLPAECACAGVYRELRLGREKRPTEFTDVPAIYGTSSDRNEDYAMIQALRRDRDKLRAEAVQMRVSSEALSYYARRAGLTWALVRDRLAPLPPGVRTEADVWGVLYKLDGAQKGAAVWARGLVAATAHMEAQFDAVRYQYRGKPRLFVNNHPDTEQGPPPRLSCETTKEGAAWTLHTSLVRYYVAAKRHRLTHVDGMLIVDVPPQRGDRHGRPVRVICLQQSRGYSARLVTVRLAWTPGGGYVNAGVLK